MKPKTRISLETQWAREAPVTDSGCQELPACPQESPQEVSGAGSLFAFGLKPLLGYLSLGIHNALISTLDYHCQELRIP